VDEVAQVTREERPDVALVGLGESSEHALEHISQIVHEAACPGTDAACQRRPPRRGPELELARRVFLKLERDLAHGVLKRLIP
jgi:hypothetical protein